LFKKDDIKDPPDCSDYEHYLKIYIAQVCCSERLTSRTHPTSASVNILSIADFREADIEVPPDCNVHEHYQSELF
jgi:hypothetical protein